MNETAPPSRQEEERRDMSGHGDNRLAQTVSLSTSTTNRPQGEERGLGMFQANPLEGTSLLDIIGSPSAWNLIPPPNRGFPHQQQHGEGPLPNFMIMDGEPPRSLHEILNQVDETIMDDGALSDFFQDNDDDDDHDHGAGILILDY